MGAFPERAFRGEFFGCCGDSFRTLFLRVLFWGGRFGGCFWQGARDPAGARGPRERSGAQGAGGGRSRRRVPVPPAPGASPGRSRSPERSPRRLGGAGACGTLRGTCRGTSRERGGGSRENGGRHDRGKGCGGAGTETGRGERARWGFRDGTRGLGRDGAPGAGYGGGGRMDPPPERDRGGMEPPGRTWGPGRDGAPGMGTGLWGELGKAGCSPRGSPQRRGLLPCLSPRGAHGCEGGEPGGFPGEPSRGEAVTDGFEARPLDHAKLLALAQASVAPEGRFVLGSGWFPPEERFHRGEPKPGAVPVIHSSPEPFALQLEERFNRAKFAPPITGAPALPPAQGTSPRTSRCWHRRLCPCGGLEWGINWGHWSGWEVTGWERRSGSRWEGLCWMREPGPCWRAWACSELHLDSLIPWGEEV